LDQAQDHRSRLLGKLDDSRLAVIHDGLDKLKPRWIDLVLEATSEIANHKIGSRLNIEREPESPESSNFEFEKSLEKLCVDFDLDGRATFAAGSYLRECVRHVLSTRPTHMHLSGQYSSLVAIFENLISSIIVEYLTRYPRDLESMSDLGIGLAELRNLKDLSELDRFFAERMADQVMSRAYDKWLAWIAAKDKRLIDLQQTVAKDDVSDLILIRNVYLHSLGKISNRHMGLIKNPARFPNSAGKGVRLRAEDFQEDVQKILTLGFSIWVQVCAKLVSDRRLVAVWATNFQVKFLRAGFYSVVAETSGNLLPHRLGPEAQVNIWLAQKALGQTEFLREVEVWDVADLGEVYRLAKTILLEDFDSAMEMAIDLRKRGGLKLSDWMEWPLLAPLREAAAANDDLQSKSIDI
jgi:hypothetical protein